MANLALNLLNTKNNIVLQVRIFQTIRLEESSRSLLVYASNNSLVTRARLGVAMAPDLHPYKCLPGRYLYQYIYAISTHIYRRAGCGWQPGPGGCVPGVAGQGRAHHCQGPGAGQGTVTRHCSGSWEICKYDPRERRTLDGK